MCKIEIQSNVYGSDAMDTETFFTTFFTFDQ